MSQDKLPPGEVSEGLPAEILEAQDQNEAATESPQPSPDSVDQLAVEMEPMADEVGAGGTANAADETTATVIESDGSAASYEKGSKEDQESAGVDADASRIEDDADEGALGLSDERLVSVIESLLFASDKPLSVPDLKRLTGVSNGKRLKETLDVLIGARDGTGIKSYLWPAGFNSGPTPSTRITYQSWFRANPCVCRGL